MIANKLFKLTLLVTIISSAAYAATVDLRVLETTDLHSNMMDFDYYKNQSTDKFGLARTASLIHQAREQAINSVLVDNGDIIQGSPMGDYVAAKGLKTGDVHPVYKALNSLNYTVGSLGNHEFNYGLDYLKTAIAGAKFPYINANIFDAKTNQPYFQQYLLVDTPVIDRDGKSHNVRIGYIGFVPPQVMQWDKINLAGKVVAKDITETAKQLVPQMRKEGADIVVVIAHSGVSADPYKAMAENSVYYLSQVPGVDAIMFGHSHGIFPSKDFANLTGADILQGTLNGIPTVMPGQWGDHLGVVDLVLEGETGKWQVTSAKAEARPIYDIANRKSLVAADPAIIQLLAEDHVNTKTFANKLIGKASDNMYSYLALVQDDPSSQIVSDAQKDYVERFIQGDPDLADLPVLSAVAPFKAGGRKNDPNGYIEVDKGDLSFRNAADLYLYSNTLVAVKAKGSEVREWLECAAGLFKQIDINSSAPQELIDWDGFRTYSFDTIDGVQYQIDITQPPRYDGNCELINANSYRIKELSYQGKPIDPKAEFLIATNNYRAYTGRFAGTGESHVAFAAPDEVRSIVAAYISAQSKAKGQVVPSADNNWRFATITTAKQPLDIRVETSPSKKAAQFIKEKALYPMTLVGTDSIGFAIYKIDLQSPQTAK